MSKVLRYEPCPKCREQGQDRSGDNLAVYSDGSSYCFARHGRISNANVLLAPEREELDDGTKSVLPRDFTREIPAAAWKWLLQYGLPFSYWKAYCGYSPVEERLVFTVGNPVRFSIGRYCGADAGERAKSDPTFRKWYMWGDHRSGPPELLGNPDSSEAKGVVLVEDLISAHKVAQVIPSIPLFGSTINEKVIAAVRALDRPVIVWLDADQWGVLPKKLNRLQAFLTHPVALS